MSCLPVQTVSSDWRSDFLKFADSIDTEESGVGTEGLDTSVTSDSEHERKRAIFKACFDAADPDSEAEAGEAFYRILGEHDDALDLLGASPNFSRQVLRAVIKRLEIRQSEQAFLRHELDRLRSDLEGPLDDPCEKLLIDQVVICYLQMYLTELSYERVMRMGVSPQGARSWEQRLTAAQKRYFRAIETLIRLRRSLQKTADTVLARTHLKTCQPPHVKNTVDYDQRMAS